MNNHYNRRPVVCHNELNNDDYTVKDAIRDLNEHLVQPRFLGEGRYKHSAH